MSRNTEAAGCESVLFQVYSHPSAPAHPGMVFDMINLLKNPSFEGVYQPWQGQSQVMVAEGWLPFWIPQHPADDVWRNRQPIYWAGSGVANPRFVRAGQTAQAYSTPWGTHIAGLTQSVTATPGQRLRLRVYGCAWSTDDDVPGASVNPGNVRMKIGIDPAGGITPFGSDVIWSVERAVYDGYDTGFSVEAIATGQSVTIFLLSAPEWPRKHNDVYWDDASLEVVSDNMSDEISSNGIVLSLTSQTQQVGEVVTICAMSPHLLQNVQVRVSGPSGSVSVRPLEVTSSDRGYGWRWAFEPFEQGPYTATVSADEVDAVTATLSIGGDALVSALGAPGGLTARGKPRVQYPRTYVLLHPTMGSEWAAAVLESELWRAGRCILGCNRDDAGIGDLNERTVLAVNPSAWPEPVESWFAVWYPGVTVRSVLAATPAELQTVLQTVDG
jgi:hypothetical protein